MKLFKEMHGGGGRGLLLGMLVILGLMGTPVPPVTGDGVVTAKIMPASATLTPTTTFEVRFSSPMIEAVDVGEPIEISPLLLEPPLPGKFTWLSERSGVFTPEKPFALGQRYTVRLRGGLTGRAGGAVIAARRVFKTPPFEVAGHTFRESTFNRTSQPEFPIAFNDGVEAKRAVKHIRFRDRTGQAIAAKARPMTHREHRRVDAPSVGWRDRFHESHGRTLEPPTPDDVITTRLLVKPERPLPAGEWRLVVGRGLPSLMPGVATVKETVIKLGVVHPLKVNAVFAMNQLYRGRSLEILFNRRLSEDLKDGDPLRWIKIRPTRGPARKAPVPEIKAEVSDRAITLKGDFVLGGYEVIIRDGLPGAENFSLADGRKEDVVFNMIQPRVFLPVWMDSQYANGHGKLRLLSLNNLDLRLRVKLVDPAHLPGTLESYRDGYFHRSSFNGRRWVHKEGRPLNFNLLPGRTLADFYTRFDEGVKPEVKRRGGEDDPAELEFNWKKLLGGRKTGVLFVQATSTGTDFRTQTSSQAIIQLTDLGVVWKSAGSPEVFAHVFSQTTGKPLPGASVELMTKENEVLAGGETDVHGTVTMAGGDRASWIRASLGDDTHILPMIGKGEVPLWQFKLNRRWGEAENRRLLMFTDRGVYKPGETIHLKGILREVDGTDVNLPEKLNCRLRVVDARGEEVFNKNHPITKLGSFDFDVSIPNGPLGNYFLHVELTRLRQDEPNQTPAPPLPGVVPQPLPPLPGDGQASSSPSPRQRPVMRRMMTVQVAEYEPPKYKVDLRQDVEVAAGADAVVPLRARYYFGKPIAKAPVKWVLEGETAGFWPEEFDSYHFLDWSRGDVDEPGNFQLDGEGKLDSDGRMKIQPNLEINPNWPGPVGGRLRARVTDPTQQTITASTQVLKHSSDFYLGIKDMKRLQYLGKPAKIELIALGANEKPHKDAVEAKVILKRIEWRSVRVRGAGGTIDYRNEKNLITIAEETVAIRADDAKGTAIFHPKRSGQYLVEVRAKDSSDRPVRSSMQFYVPGPQPLAWDYRNEATIELVPDQKRYQPGDEAVILVKTPISGRALVTVEREKVLRSFQVELKGNAPAIHVPLQSGDAPNVFISVCLLRGAADSKRKVAAAEYRLGYCELEVEKTDGLNVELSLSQPEYRPGQEVKVTARILNIEGQPAAHAEVTLFAIDQGVLDLTGHRHPDPLEFFIRPIPLAVETYTSFPFMLTEDPAKAAFGNKGHLIGGGGKLASLRMRKNFLACAFWNANLRTDAEGRVRVQFKAPDGLTSYRVVAIVHTKDSDFGVADTSFRINKPLMIEAALPRFARTGDQIETRAVVFNQTQREREVVIDLKLSSNARIMEGQSTRKAIVAPGSSRAVMIPVEFIKTGECTADWRVAFSDEPGLGDALKTKLTIHHAAPLRREILLARIDGSEANLLKKADPQLLNGKGTVAVSISNTRLIELGEAADYLLTYPYGCVEQTSSGMLPWVILGSKRDAIPQINVPKAASRRAVKYGVRRLMSMQTPDGGLAYWPGGRVSMLWGSAYGAIALAHAELEGFRIPESALERLGDYLSRELRKKKENYHHYGLHDQCLSLYALALLGRPEPAYHEKMYQKRRHLTDPDRALLALAVQIANGPRDMAHVLLTDPGRKPLYGWFGCPSQSLAVQLLAWAHHDPNSEKVDRLLTQLLAGRKNGHWVTTQGNAWSVIALAAYADLVEGEPQAISGTIVWQGKNHPFALDGKNRSVRMNFQHADDGAEPVMELKNPANRRIYSNIRLETRTRLRITPRQNRGFSIRRSYSRLEENGKLNDAPEWRVGDLICVSLHLDVKEPGHYVAIDDPLPAVLEAMNPRFKTQQNAGEKKRTWDWMVSHTEIRADRMLYFVDHLPPGQHTFRYLARVRAPGKAIAAATKIEEMYHPDRHGVSASRDLTAQPLD